MYCVVFCDSIWEDLFAFFLNFIFFFQTLHFLWWSYSFGNTLNFGSLSRVVKLLPIVSSGCMLELWTLLQIDFFWTRLDFAKFFALDENFPWFCKLGSNGYLLFNPLSCAWLGVAIVAWKEVVSYGVELCDRLFEESRVVLGCGSFVGPLVCWKELDEFWEERILYGPWADGEGWNNEGLDGVSVRIVVGGVLWWEMEECVGWFTVNVLVVFWWDRVLGSLFTGLCVLLLLKVVILGTCLKNKG